MKIRENENLMTRLSRDIKIQIKTKYLGGLPLIIVCKCINKIRVTLTFILLVQLFLCGFYFKILE